MSYKRRRTSAPTRSFYGSAARLATNYAYKYLTSGTQTKQNRDFNHMVSNQHTSIGSTNLTVVVNKRKPRHKKGEIRYFDGRSKLVKNFCGGQNVAILNVIGSNSQWMTGVSEGVVTDDDLGPQPLIYMNPDTYNTGGVIIPPQGFGDANQLDGLCLSNVGLTYDMTNTSTTGNFIYLYFVTPRQDTSQSPIVAWSEAMNDVDYGKSEAVFPPAGTDVMAPASLNNFHVGLKPTLFRLFNRKWRTLKVRKVELGSGASEKISVQIKTNYSVYHDLMASTDEKYLANKTVIVMAVQHGSVVVDTTSDPAGLATYSSSQTAICSQVKYLMHPAQSRSNKFDYAIGACRIPSNATEANQRMVDTKDAIASVQLASG